MTTRPKVLIPMDGSERTYRAMQKALRMLEPLQPEVTLLCVREDVYEESSEELVEAFDEDEDDEIFPTPESVDRMFEEALKRAADVSAVVPSTKAVAGKIRKAIIEEANGGGYDLMVMHHLGKSQLKEKMRASATEHLTRQVECSVLLMED